MTGTMLDDNAASAAVLARNDEFSRLLRVHDSLVPTSSSSSTTAKTQSTCKGLEGYDTKDTDNSSNSNNNSGQQSSSHDHQRPIPAAFVSGLSGTGKSHLIQTFFQQLEDRNQSKPELTNRAAYIMQGKVDEYTGTNDPYMAITQAVSGLVLELLQGRQEELTAIQQRLCSAISRDDANVLIRIFPSLKSLFKYSFREVETEVSIPLRTKQAVVDLDEADNAAAAWHQIQYLFVQFIKALSMPVAATPTTPEAMPEETATAPTSPLNEYPATSTDVHPPVIIFFDDLQWASSVTLKLLQHVLSDPTIQNFMFIGAVRLETDQQHAHEDRSVGISNPVNDHRSALMELAEDHPVALMLQELPSEQKLNHIHLSNPTQGEVHAWIAKLLNQNEDSIRLLAHKIYAKTNGNPFFVMQTIEQLKRTKSLIYNVVSSSWELKAGNITRGEDYSERTLVPLGGDVIEIIVAKLQSLPIKLQQVIVVAAFIRSQFEHNVLASVWVQAEAVISISLEDSNIGGPEDRTSRGLDSYLEQAVLEGLLGNTIGAAQYRFAHDRIQQAACSLIKPGEDRKKLQHCIGLCLLQEYRKSSADDSLLFVAADHLNDVMLTDYMFLTKMNLEVGERLLKKAALAPASVYLKKAQDSFQKIPGNSHAANEHYEMAIRLNHARGSAELALGHYELGQQLCSEVFKTAVTFKEQAPTYLALVNSLGRQDRNEEAFVMACHATQEMGVYPKRWHLAHVAKDWRPISRFFLKNSDADILNMPLNTDPYKRLAVKFLNEQGVRAFYIKKMFPWIVSLCKQFKTIMKHGLCPQSALSFVSYAMVCDNMNDHAKAVRIALLARKVLDVTDGKALEGWIYFISTSYTLSWSRPKHEVLNSLRRGRTSAMECGDLEVAFLNWEGYNFSICMFGHNLNEVIKSREKMLEQAKLYQVHVTQRIYGQSNMLLRGLTGENQIDWDEIASFGVGINYPGELYYLIAGYGHRLQLAVYFFKYECAVEVSARYTVAAADDTTYQQMMLRNFFTGLALVGRYRDTKKRKYLGQFLKLHASFISLLRNRGMNSFHRRLILEAEKLSVSGASDKELAESYDLAIAVSRKEGYIQDAALAFELAGETFLRLGKHECIGDYFTRAAELYYKWGCMAKVEHLKEHRMEYLDEGRLAQLNENMEHQPEARIVSTAGLRGHTAGSAGLADVLTSGTPSYSIFTPNSCEKVTLNDPRDDDLSVLTGAS